jgi:LmbE family N-acetylglucosaminyl deacetylase
LQVLGTVLYVAAHPDDENTRLISYLSNDQLVRTGYLSATRGDGGQNLIGPEIRELLGLIRTQELLAARRTDGGVQFFSRANDFGYSKHPDETLTIWDKEQVLSDFVRVIRTFRPDVLITRFSLKPGVTHGHHTTSAMLAKEAFELAGDDSAFPEQLQSLDTWQPSKIFWNTSWWFYRNSGETMDTSKFITVNVGEYNRNLGKSYTEIAAESRSMHKSQGFGATGSRGDEIEYLEQWGGVPSEESLFEGVDISWNRVENSAGVERYVREALDLYNPQNPEGTLAALFKAREEMLRLEDQFWKEIKLQEIDELIQVITGTYLEVVAEDYAYVPGDSIKMSIEAINRYGDFFELESITMEPWGTSLDLNYDLDPNQTYTNDINLVIPADMDYSHPYWLNSKASLGMYNVPDPELIGTPENEPVFTARFTLKWEDQYFNYVRPVVYKTNDPVDGEVYRPVEITPPVMVNFDASTMIFAREGSKSLQARVIAGQADVSGELKLQLPEGWQVSPSVQEFSIQNKFEEQVFEFEITPPPTSQEQTLIPRILLSNGKEYSRGLTIIDYDHIPVQTLFPETEVKLVKIDVKKEGDMVGYVAGAGDEIPDALEQMGYTVVMLQKDDVTAENLDRFDAVVLGIRAYNTVDWLSYKNKELFEYAKRGGTLVTQYNTSYRMMTEEVSPIPMKLSRDRVTVEEAEIRILAPDHPVLNTPNKIREADFREWVQERGLYFPNEWDDQFTAVLSSNDPGEDPKDGGLLVAKYGKGYFVYSGYSWFRQLPAGVPGAFRLFANMVSLGNETTEKTQ